MHWEGLCGVWAGYQALPEMTDALLDVIRKHGRTHILRYFYEISALLDKRWWKETGKMRERDQMTCNKEKDINPCCQGNLS